VQVWVWLFNDLVLLGKPKHSKYLEESKRKPNCFTIVGKVGLGEVRLVNLSTVEGSPPPIISRTYSLSSLATDH
jgi:S-adenosylhomocysteine hydrolase